MAARCPASPGSSAPVSVITVVTRSKEIGSNRPAATPARTARSNSGAGSAFSREATTLNGTLSKAASRATAAEPIVFITCAGPKALAPTST